MSTDNLILTEHAIKRHAKRLQKQMKNYNQDLSLGESQNLLSKILGFNDWNHLNTILKPAIEKEVTSSKTIKIFETVNVEQGIQILISLFDSEKYSMLANRAILLISALLPALYYMKEQHEILLDSVAIKEYMILDNMIKMYKTRRDFPNYIRGGLHTYLYSLAGFNSSAPIQTDTVKEQHESIQTHFFLILQNLEKIEKDNFIIADKFWFKKEDKLIKSNFINFGKKQEYIGLNFLNLNYKDIFNHIENIEDSWINMEEYEDYVLHLERNNQLNCITICDLIIYLTTIISPNKKQKMFLLLKSILDHYSVASEISKKIQNKSQNIKNV